MPLILHSVAARIVGVVCAGAMLASLSAAPVAATTGPTSAADAVAAAVPLINADRAAAGLVPYRIDQRLSGIAAERASAMASTGVLSHEGPDGRTAFDLIEEAGIAWYGAGEVIAWNTWPSGTDSAIAANEGWMASDVHRGLLLSAADNYVGVGVATSSSGVVYWSAIFMSGPDRTAAWARAGTPSMTRLATGSSVRFGWTGGDVPLQVQTSGLRDFQLQRRVDGAAWLGVTSSTLLRAWTFRVAPGHRYEFRVRARDRAGNVGAWTQPVGVTA